VEADAVGHIMSEGVQLELVGLLSKAAASSLDVERKHNQDKRSETTRVTGCSTASKNSILRRYSVYRKTVVGLKKDRQTRYEKAMKMNVRALAIQKTRTCSAAGGGGCGGNMALMLLRSGQSFTWATRTRCKRIFANMKIH
jgi:hypothetical protein